MAQLLKRDPSARRRRARGEEGVGMAMTMVVVTVVFSLGAMWLSFANQSTGAAGYERRRQQAVDAANAGLVVAAASLGKSKDYTGTGATAIQFSGGSAQYEVTVTTDSSDASGLTKVMTAIGYAPAKTTPRRVARTLQQVVKLVPQLGGGSFPYVIMSSQGIKMGSNTTLVGDIYANSTVELGANQTVNGNVYAQADVKTKPNFTLNGNIWARANVEIEANSTIHGSVTTQGGITIKPNGRIDDNAVATGNLDPWPCPSSRVGGTCQRYQPVEPPPQQAFPQFQYNQSNYPGLTYYASGPAMVTALNGKYFSGNHFANSGPSFQHNDKWFLTGDTTILFNGTIKLPGTIVNASPGGGNIQLTVISVSSGDILSNSNMSIPATIRTLLYGNQIGSSANVTMSGAIYGINMSGNPNFTLTYAPVNAVPGFTFSGGGTVTSYNIRNVSTREVATA